MFTRKLALEEPERFFDMGVCPFCLAPGTRITKTERPTRYFKCDACGCTWRAVMVHLAFEGALDAAAALKREKNALDTAVPFF